MKQLFFGGVHPRYNKEISALSGELKSVTSKQLVIPLKQHIGNACKPLVSVGERVKLGQKIGDGNGMCVPVHSSVSGTVSAIEPRLHPNGKTVNSVIIENDFKEEAIEFEGCNLPLERLDDGSILRAIREAGIVGMGGAAFPGNLKVLSAMGNIDTVIANACECEPYITSDDTLLRTNPEQVFEGMIILKKVLSPERAIIAIEDNKAAAIERLNKLRDKYPEIEISVLPTRYPQGSEKQLIQAVTQRQVPPAGLPIDVGCVVFNVSTFAAIFKAVRLGIPLTERIVTVTGEAIANPQNLSARIGTPFFDLIEAAGGLKENAYRVINGGPMMGTAQPVLSVPVVKATASILCLPKPEENKQNQACIRCGKCVEACPMHLKPLYLYRFTLAKTTDELNRLNLVDCLECGCCSFTCPASLPLVEKFRFAKNLMKEKNEQ